jgi:chemotaxis methyl-accepting protein methylase
MGIIHKFRRGEFIKAIAKLHSAWHQGPNTTSLNRYPEIFDKSAAVLPNARLILSFGCSTGQECATLANNSLPK